MNIQISFLQTVVTSCSLENLTSIVDDFQFENFDGNSSSDRLPSDASVTVFCYKTYAYQRYWHSLFDEMINIRYKKYISERAFWRSTASTANGFRTPPTARASVPFPRSRMVTCQCRRADFVKTISFHIIQQWVPRNCFIAYHNSTLFDFL